MAFQNNKIGDQLRVLEVFESHLRDKVQEAQTLIDQLVGFFVGCEAVQS